ncbi:serine hydrolase domain-containing protein [Lentisalinibacter sediminis]|uniref:serine hydrolase domain-containing protein n=1 Tax=Lentisalinibacter sediminis TaxID=2992237 RepID=UPI003866C98D
MLLSPLLVAEDFRDRFTAVTPLNFDAGGTVSRQFHLNVGAYRPQMTIYCTGDTRALPVVLREAVSGQRVRHSGGEDELADYVAGDPLLDSVIVLHRGEVVFEAYPRMQPWERHFAWSVTKVLTAATLAVLVVEDRVEMAAPVERYLPALDGSAWAGTSLQSVADMASGIDCLDSDGYHDPDTCIYQLEESLGITADTGREPDFVGHLRSMSRLRPAASKNEYVSANTAVLGQVIEAVTGRPLAEAVQVLLWSRIGPEADGLMTVSNQGYAYAGGGLSARLRDVGHLGLAIMEGGPGGESILTTMQSGGTALTNDRKQTLIDVFADDMPVRAAWQWDLVWPDGAHFKLGYDGQGLYIDPARQPVIAAIPHALPHDNTTFSIPSAVVHLPDTANPTFS